MIKAPLGNFLRKMENLCFCPFFSPSSSSKESDILFFSAPLPPFRKFCILKASLHFVQLTCQLSIWMNNIHQTSSRMWDLTLNHYQHFYFLNIYMFNVLGKVRFYSCRRCHCGKIKWSYFQFHHWHMSKYPQWQRNTPKGNVTIFLCGVT